MAKRVFAAYNQTFTAAAQGTVLGNATYMGLKGGSSTQLIDVLEVLISGMATASIVAGMTLARVLSVSTTDTALASPNSDGPMHPSTAALAAPPVSQVAATGGPSVSTATGDAHMNLGLNIFGGILRWNAAPTQQFSILGNTAANGQAILYNSSTFGGSSGLANAHIIYEPY